MRTNKYRYLKIAMLVLIGIALVATPVQAQEAVSSGGFNPKALLCDQALPWIQNLGLAGSIAFICIYAVGTVAFFPGSILTLGGGAIFGLFLGSLYVFIGATIGATLAFLVGRYIARGWVSKKIAGNKKFAAIDKAVGKEGFKIVALTRLSPIFPFNLLNYGLGVTGVSLKDYVLASIGMIPGTIMYVYFGSLGNINTICNGGGTGDNSTVKWAIRIIGLIITVAITLYVTKIARKALDESIDGGEIAGNEPQI
ncbi:MAG: TVP38/TMEM64 family protein [Waterburya sp.]